jgi:hypothetical protein
MIDWSFFIMKFENNKETNSFDLSISHKLDY